MLYSTYDYPKGLHMNDVRGHAGWRRTVGRFWALCICFVLPVTAQAGRDPEAWDSLPRVDSISFSKTSIGLTTSSGEYFVLNRAGSKLLEVDKRQFLSQFGNALGPKAAEIKEQTGVGSFVVLRASNGKEFETRNAYCSEGQDMKHGLWLEGVSIDNHVDPCHSISSAEVVDDQLWLGTRWDGEYGEYPAAGIVVQSLDKGRLLKKVGAEQGLTGNLVRAIRIDPGRQSVWVATERGIDEIDRDFRVSMSRFFYEDLDPKTGLPRVNLISSWQKSDPLVAIHKQLGVSDSRKFYDAVVQIPVAIRERFVNERDVGHYNPADRRPLEQSFAPKEMNVLVPFFVAAAGSANRYVRSNALFSICAFNDRRVMDFLIAQNKDLPVQQDAYDLRFVNECLGKYARFGLVTDAQTIGAIALKRLAEALKRTHRSSIPGDFQLIVASARSLKQAGDRRGMDLINEHFMKSDTRSVNVGLYDYVGQNLVYDSEIAPAMLEGLKKIHGGLVSRGCQFFDMRWNFMPRRFDVSYAEAIFGVINRQSGSPGDASVEGVCVEAFKSQLANASVRDAFFRDVYPTLPKYQQALADKLGK